MCCLFEIKGIHNVKIAINNSMPINYESNMPILEDLRVLIVDEQNKEEIKDVMGVYRRHRFGAIAICSRDKENTKYYLSRFSRNFRQDSWLFIAERNAYFFANKVSSFL